MLKELAPPSYLGVGRFFGNSHPNLAFVRAVLEQRIPGSVFANFDRHGDPVTVLITTGSPFCFLSGYFSPTVMGEVDAILADRPFVRLVHSRWGPEELVGDLHSFGFKQVERIQLSIPGVRAGDYRVHDQVPGGFTLERVTEEIFHRLNWRDPVLDIFGTMENYLSHGYGVCMLSNNIVVAESHGVIGGGLVELGSITHPEYRRRSFSSITMSEAIRHGARLGLAPVTSMDVENRASFATCAGPLRMSMDFRYHLLTRQAD
ncbi:GNAT family N-acetyltransferase [Streptomyces sp. NPDC020490]|uniref:GNAT family N-acetyltransferase n=1 Tax=Streptomyces sp. NPDC020490 TaxID=3365078 RepID=UPI0037AE4B34